MRRTVVIAAAVAALLVLAGSGAGSDSRADRSAVRWTLEEAKSIRSVRGLRVRVLECRGLGAAHRDDREVRFPRFACLAGARLPWERFDSVAVRYELRPLRAYDGSARSYALERVSFTGGPGIP